MNALRTILFSFAVTVTAACQASHVRGGELWYEYVGAVPGGLLYEIQIDLYFDPSSPSENPNILLYVDGNVDTLSASGIIFNTGLCAQATKTYNTTHIFSGPGTYVIAAEVFGRRQGITNVQGNSEVPIGLTTTLTVDVGGPNSSPRFNAPVNDVTYNWSTLMHDPLVIDPDGDSLSFELVTPLGLGLLPIPGYLLPDVATGPGDFTWIDPATGVFLWDQPNMMGYFQIAILCTERRLINGTWTVIGHVTRDMPLCVGQLPTGISDTASTETPILTPLGSYGLFTITSATRFAEVHVLDATGRLVVLQGTTPNGMLDLSGLTSGTYVVTLRSASGSASSRVALIR